MASPAFERFRFSFFEDPDSPRNGLDLAALGALEGDERSRAEEMLLQYLPDTRGVIGLGRLRSRRAETALAVRGRARFGIWQRPDLPGEGAVADPARSVLARAHDRHPRCGQRTDAAARRRHRTA